ncbi:Ntn_hydrolase domain containing protein [uncultured Caudovirales phage]|uniref:Ntn_hydrolase domain containing protein n=1 Tax=uncultured Caudovirales phage TaxID=2100421 RepID=A0A6J5RTJ5_9CAUD|nr:Ntn_hydrolase domain containing protein [uncultured Caudovirales phage]
MTCVVGFEDKGNIYIGADSAGVAGLELSIRADEKVFINGPFIVGFAGSFRMGQLLRYKFDPPKQSVKTDDMKYMVTDFIDAVRKCFTDNGFGSASTGGLFLVGYNKKLYRVDSDFQVGKLVLPYAAIGCGDHYALGSMFSSSNKKPEDKVKFALQTASTFSAGVAPPFKILKLSK